MARFVGSIGPDSQFARAARARSKAVLAQRMERVAERAAQLADQYVREAYDTERPAWRRRPGRHLAGSFSGRVTSSSGDSLTIAITTLAPGVKVWALNSGSAPHRIRPRTATELVFPATNTARKGARGGLIRTQEVSHPGTRPTHFLDRAMEEAIRGALGASVRRSTLIRAAMAERASRAIRG